MNPDDNPQEPVFGAGSLRAIVYCAFQLLDEVLHFFDRFKWLDWLTDTQWRFDFCQWCYRYDWCHQCKVRKRREQEQGR